MKLGVHTSIAGGIDSALDRAKKLGCNTMQIFARNPRQWRKESLSEPIIALFKEKVQRYKISPIVIHSPYSLNLAAAKDSFHQITIKEFTEDLQEADKLGADFLVTHMGSHKGLSERNGLLKITSALKQILDNTPEIKTKVLLENTSGSGNWLGYKFSHFNFIYERIGWTDRVGICLDTAHLWAAGYKIDSQEGVNRLFTEILQQVGDQRVEVIHLNDTKEKLNSRHDRHCNIGEGLIGKKGFYFFLRHQLVKNLPLILETPKTCEDDDLKNLKAVKDIYKGKFEESEQ